MTGSNENLTLQNLIIITEKGNAQLIATGKKQDLQGKTLTPCFIRNLKIRLQYTEESFLPPIFIVFTDFSTPSFYSNFNF
jgi:hypothetical protein